MIVKITLTVEIKRSSKRQKKSEPAKKASPQFNFNQIITQVKK